MPRLIILPACPCGRGLAQGRLLSVPAEFDARFDPLPLRERARA